MNYLSGCLREKNTSSGFGGRDNFLHQDAVKSGNQAPCHSFLLLRNSGKMKVRSCSCRSLLLKQEVGLPLGRKELGIKFLQRETEGSRFRSQGFVRVLHLLEGLHVIMGIQFQVWVRSGDENGLDYGPLNKPQIRPT